MGFKRARTDEQIEERRIEILTKAKKLCLEHGAMKWSFNELGRRCIINKSNLYRYFTSKEEVLMQLLADEMKAFILGFDETVKENMANNPKETKLSLADFSSLLASEYQKHSLFCELLSIGPSILEHNVDIESIANIKRPMIDFMVSHIATFKQGLKWITDEEAALASKSIAIHVAGLWPVANPSETIFELSQRPEFTYIQFNFKEELTHFINTLLLGYKASQDLRSL